jgi:hypothetical protein
VSELLAVNELPNRTVIDLQAALTQFGVSIGVQI